jgi:gliding motility-associated-like protein
MINGSPVGADSVAFITHALQNGDTVSCLVTSAACPVPDSADSSVVVQVLDSIPASLTISASSTDICSGDTVTFTALPINGGSDPTYEWTVDQQYVGSHGNSFVSDSLYNGDIVSCLLLSGQACAAAAPSQDSITMTVKPTPKVFAGDDTVIIPGASVYLDPTITGNISGYQWSPPTGLNNPSIPQAIASPDTTTTYQLTVGATDGFTAKGFLTIAISHPLKMPGAFTPNGDGINDIFRIPPSTPQKITSFSVFNRCGNRVFWTTDANVGWDGTAAGRPQPVGAYVWVIEYVDLFTRTAAVAKGTVVLMR